MDFLLGTKPTKDVMNVDDASKAEFESYLNVPEVDNDTCPLKWWKENETRFPALLKQATKYLGVPATSVPAERVFSAARNVNMLLFLKKMK